MTAHEGRDDYMAHKDSEANDATAQRKARLAEALRANLQKRKAQARSKKSDRGIAVGACSRQSYFLNRGHR